MFSGYGCSERIIAGFSGRDRGTIRKYIDPIRKVIEASLEPAERDDQLQAVIERTRRTFIIRKERLVKEGCQKTKEM
jgi:hypothetical protein